VAFFQELPVVLAKLEPYLTSQLQISGSLDALLKLREWQETLVSLTILAKKYRVGGTILLIQDICIPNRSSSNRRSNRRSRSSNSSNMLVFPVAPTSPGTSCSSICDT
jgi:hypothetical protein